MGWDGMGREGRGWDEIARRGEDERQGIERGVWSGDGSGSASQAVEQVPCLFVCVFSRQCWRFVRRHAMSCHVMSCFMKRLHRRTKESGEKEVDERRRTSREDNDTARGRAYKAMKWTRERDTHKRRGKSLHRDRLFPHAIVPLS